MAWKLGLDQIGVPAPVFYKRLVNAFIIIIVPSTVAFTLTFVQNSFHRELISAAGIYVSALLKGLEYLLGNGSNGNDTQNSITLQSDKPK